MSKVIDIPVSPTTSAPELKRKIKAAKVKNGDTLKFSFSNNVLFAVFVILILVIVRSVLAAQRKETRQKEGADILNSVLDGEKSQEELEQEIADEYGVNVEFELAKANQFDPLKAGFGIWKDSDITLEKIREKAWPKRA